LDIVSVNCSGSTPAGADLISIGTKAISGLLSTNYTLPAIPNSTDPGPVPPPQNYQSILQVAPGTLQAGLFQGTFSLFAFVNGTVGGCFSNRSNSLTVQLNFDNLGVVHQLSPCPDPNGFIDLFAAADKGITFFTYSQPDLELQIILSAVPFRQIVASRNGSMLVALAVSASNELYYVEGTRDNPHSSKISWLIK
jgi:hypothetical protein